MSVGRWVKSSAEYGQRILDAGIEGARSGEDEFLEDKRLISVLGESVKDSMVPTAVGVAAGVLLGYVIYRRNSTARSLACGLLGGLLGFSGGMAWENRRLGASVVGGAMKNIGKVRDEQWLRRHPINYA